MAKTETSIEAVEGAISEVVGRLVQQFHPEKLILFGSAARGTFGPDSDLDILVVTSTQGSRRELAVAMELALMDIPFPIDLILVTPQEVERDKRRIGAVVRPALEQGRVLYERAA